MKCLKLRIALMALAFLSGTKLMAGSILDQEIPEACAEDKIKEQLRADGMEVVASNIEARRSICILAYGQSQNRNVRSYVVNLNFAPDSCDAATVTDYFEGVNSTSDSLFKGKLALRQGVCKYVRASSDLRDLNALNRNHLGLLAEIQTHLRDAQLKGLDGRNQAFAGFLEGIIEASRAEVLLRVFKQKPGQTNIVERTDFCQSRRIALGDFSAIDWGAFDFEFAASYTTAGRKPKPSVPSGFENLTVQLPGLLAGFNSGTHALSSLNASTCAEFNAISDADKEAIATAATKTIVDEYLKVGPIGDMLSRKVDRVALPVKAFQLRLDRLEKKAQAQKGKYTGVRTTFDQRIRDPLIQAVTQYESAYATIYAIDDWLQRWKTGLMISPMGEDTGRILRETLDALDGNLNAATLAQFDQGFTNFRNNFETMLNRPQAFAQNTKMLCRVLYCEARGTAAGIDRFKSECKNTNFENLPLCKETESYKLTPSDSGKTVRALCKEAGLEDRFLTLPMSANDQNDCLKTLAQEQVVTP